MYNFLLLLQYLGCRTNERSIPYSTGIFPSSAVSGLSGVLLCVFWVFIAEEVDGVGGKGSVHTTTIDEQIYLEDVLNTALTSLCFKDEALFFW